jgi:predicted porin
MNKNIKLAVAGAVLALSATANAGIIIPAGDWTVDLGGNVNAFVSNVDTETTTGAGTKTKARDSNTIGTGLLPSALGIGAKTRQNDIDTAIQFTFFTGSSAGSDGGRNGSAGGNNSLNIRQAFLTFGDKSWGTFKLGRDLGISVLTRFFQI